MNRVELSQVEYSRRCLAAASMHPASSSEHCRCRAGDEEIARSVGVGGSTVNRTKRRFAEGNLEWALSEQPRPGVEQKRMGKGEGLLVATACAVPAGRSSCWQVRQRRFWQSGMRVSVMFEPVISNAIRRWLGRQPTSR